MKDNYLYSVSKNYRQGYNDGIQTLEKIAKLFEEEFPYYQGWALDKWYEIKDILENEYWED